MKQQQQDFTKYEIARILGARALQISMDAPLLLKIAKEELEQINYDPLKIAQKELESGVLPITINRPMPDRREEDIEKIKIEIEKVTDEKKEIEEKVEEKEVEESGEIVGVAAPEEEVEEEIKEEALEQEDSLD